MRVTPLLPLVLAAVLAACTGSGPQESDLIGNWEATSTVPYVLLDYRGTNDGHLVARGNAEGNTGFLIISLSSFDAGADDFTLLATYAQNGQTQTRTINGEIHDSQLALYLGEIISQGDAPTWFTRSEIFDASRDAARSALDTYRISTN